MKIRYISLGICSALVMIGTLNYSGMCMSEGRWLSDEERIKLEIERIVGRKKEYISELHKNNDGYSYGGHHDVIPYKSVEEFKKINPDCCSIRKKPTQSFAEFFGRMLGADSGKMVVVNYLQRFYYEGELIEQLVAPDLAHIRYQNNCGVVFPYHKYY
jgi:hypothetical protein